MSSVDDRGGEIPPNRDSEVETDDDPACEAVTRCGGLGPLRMKVGSNIW